MFLWLHPGGESQPPTATTPFTQATSTNNVQTPTVPCDTNPYHVCTKDATHVYAEGVLLVGADPKTFVVLGDYYGKDDRHVYWITHGEEGPNPHEIDGADPQTFATLPEGDAVAKDKNHVYWMGALFPVPDADPATFVLMSGDCGTYCGYFARDKNHVYEIVDGKIVVNAQTIR